jgi:hypothetical protein
MSNELTTETEQSEHLLDKIDNLLTARPFRPFELRCGVTKFIITDVTMARFNRHGNLELRIPSTCPTCGQSAITKHTLASEHINLVELLP